jgi:glutaredoxin
MAPHIPVSTIKIVCKALFTMLYYAHYRGGKAPVPTNKPHIKLYTLSTCSHCTRTKRFFKENGIDMEFIDVDLLTGAEREKIMDEVRKYNPDCSFPTICIGNNIIVGFNEEKLKKALDLP